MSAHAHFGKKTVLVVDDASDIRELLAMILRMKGIGVVEAENGKRAVELAHQVRPDLILMDLSMPVFDGYEATRQLHGHGETRSIPIVAVSAFCDSHSQHKAIEAGCVDCVGKPVDFGVINGLLERHLQVH